MLPQSLTWEDNKRIDGFVQYCYEGNMNEAIITYEDMNDEIRHTYANNGRPFQMACFGGHLHIATWIHHTIHRGKIVPEYYDEAFYLACSAGHDIIVRWLYSIGCIDIYKDSSRAFNRAKANGHNHIVEFFISIDKRFS
jgi:hypothetical protein